MIQTAVVGYGTAGKYFHAYLISLEPGLHLAAISTRNPNAQAAAQYDYPHARIYGSLDGLLQDDQVELVVLATPHHTHKALAIQALKAGKHVVIDKVMCMNAQEAQEILEVAERNGRILSVFHNRRWDWDFLTVQKVLGDGLIGRPYLFEAAILRYGAPQGWRASAQESGGILFDWPAHFIDQALLLVDGPLESVFCDVKRLDGWDSDIENYARLLLYFANGITYNIEIGNLATINKPRWYILGDRGGLIKYGIDPQEKAMKAGNIDAATEEAGARARVITLVNGVSHRERVIESVRGSWKSYYRNIADVLKQDGELAVTAAQMLRLMRVYDAALESARTRKVVEVQES